MDKIGDYKTMVYFLQEASANKLTLLGTEPSDDYDEIFPPRGRPRNNGDYPDKWFIRSHSYGVARYYPGEPSAPIHLDPNQNRRLER